MRDRHKVLAVAGFAVAILATNHPTADFRLFTHDVGDRTPHRIQAAMDLGVVGISFVYTWTQHLR
jgi:hypothetical protein